MKLSLSSLLFGASVVVVAAVATGLFVLGSPSEERERRFDDRRATDLHVIAAGTDLYWTRHSRLPESLEELASEPGVQISTNDPVTSESYDYGPLGGTRYEVCANFDQESVEVSGGAGIPSVFQPTCQVCHAPGAIAGNIDPNPAPTRLPTLDLWAHDSGPQCFRFEAETVR